MTTPPVISRGSCLVLGCGGEVPAGLLMCREHWSRVSPATQAAVRRSRRRDVPLRDRVEAGRKALREAAQ